VVGVAFWLGARTHQGRLLALATVLLAAAAALAMVAERRVSLGRGASIGAAAVLVALLLVVPAAAIARYGSRPTAGHHAASFSGRTPLWHQAWDDWEAHRVLGSGAGTFEEFWVAHRRTSAYARDAHSLYLETLAELGPVGLGLLVAALAVVGFVGLIGNGALDASARAASSERWRQSVSEARKAVRWLPWSVEAWRRLAIAQSNEGDLAAARASLRRAIAKSPDEWR